MNKKGAILTYITLAGFFLALTIFYLYKPEAPDTSKIGEIQMATLKAMQEAEKDLLYIDNAAKISSYKTIYELAQNGGLNEGKCGSYRFNLWNNKEGECFPDYKNNFTFLLNEELNNYLFRFNLIDNYNFILNQNDKLQIIGLAVNDLVLDIKIIAEKVRAIVEYIVPKDAEEIVKKIKEIYGDGILREIELNDPKPEESLIIGVIAQESKGNPRIISPTGCAGLMQFCYGTAEGFKDIFEKLTRCDCTGELCKTSPKCNIDNDGRFDPDKSIEAGVKYISQLLKKFEKYDAKEEFAAASYNAGEDVIKKAIDKAEGKSWQEVAQQITPDLITYFKTHKEKENKIGEIKSYVANVMGYKKKYEELSQNQITGMAVKSFSEDNSLGKYSVNSSFKVNIDYNLDGYQNAIDNAKQLIKECKDKENVKECVDNQVKTFANKENYIENCELEEEKVVNDFIEIYESCSESKDANCYCEMNFDYDKEYTINYDYNSNIFKINDFEKEYTLILIPFLEKIKIKKNEAEADLINPEVLRSGEATEKKYNINGDLVFYKTETSIADQKVQNIQIAKKKNNELELFNKNKIKELKECNLKPQRKFKFCYETSKKVLTEKGMKNPVIRFALMFPDTKAPEALSIEALNYPNDKYKIILTWNKAEEDVELFRIYYSDEEFKDKNIDELEIDIELTLDAEKINDIDLKKCEFDPVGESCKFDIYNKKLESNKLYYIENGKYKDRYVYVLNLEGKYNFLITAVDSSDNEINKIIEDKNYREIKSENRLPPMEVEDLEVKQKEGDVVLTWKKPEKYKDGSDFKDEELKEYMIRLINKKTALKDDITLNKEKNTHTFSPMNIMEYTFRVAAINNNNIIGDYAFYSS